MLEKIKEWILSKTSLANLNSLQSLRKVQKPLSKYGPLFNFLTTYNDSYAKEVAAHYVSLASKIYFENIKKKVLYVTASYTQIGMINKKRMTIVYSF